MGIDAEILIRYRGPKPTELQLAKWSWELAASVGADRFWISDGLRPPAYAAAMKAWNAAFEAHPRFGEWKAAKVSGLNGTARIDSRPVHAAILADIGKAPNEMRRAIELTNERYPIEPEDRDIPAEFHQPGRCYLQDGDPIFAEPYEWLLEVAVSTRYYGVGYERGDLLGLCAIAEWIEANITGAEVWYGGDSSGVCAEPWPESARAKLRRHLYSPKGRDYFKDTRGEMHDFGKPPRCSLCVPDRAPTRHGWGPAYALYSCAGCGKSVETRDGGKTWVTPEKWP